jgi:hypothetical protein
MPRGKRSGGKPPKCPIERYGQSDKKRINNPPFGLVVPETDPIAPTHKTDDDLTPVRQPRDLQVCLRRGAGMPCSKEYFLVSRLFSGGMTETLAALEREWNNRIDRTQCVLT